MDKTIADLATAVAGIWMWRFWEHMRSPETAIWRIGLPVQRGFLASAVPWMWLMGPNAQWS